jgi:hypothetical protein
MIELAVDPRNPGEVLAACGLFNLAARHGRAQGQFTSEGRFRLDTLADLETLLAMLDSRRLAVAEDLSWVSLGGIHLNWWMREGEDFKLWAGQVNPDNLVRDLLDACDRVRARAVKGELLSVSAPMTKRFGADPRSSWISLDIGYSPNDQGKAAIHTRPFTELLAMIGLQTFLPRQCDSYYVYHLWQPLLSLLPARLAFAGVTMPIPGHRYRFTVSKSGSFSVFNFAEPEE